MKQSGNNSMKQMVYAVLLISGISYGTMVHADFDSGSDGSDGALKLDTPGEFLFEKNAFDPALDADGDGIFHFTTIEVAEGVTVKFPSGMGPVTWLATGDVVIDGVLDLSGGDGYHKGQPAINSLPGSGGFGGGMGGIEGNVLTTAQKGYGAGGGGVFWPQNSNGGGAGYYSRGESASAVQGGSGGGGVIYGNKYLLPLIGGSGGGGGGSNSSVGTGSGGGAGGGAILIAGSGQIQVSGKIIANGGNGGGRKVADTDINRCGGGGSGGAIRLVAQKISGNGFIVAIGGQSFNEDGSECQTAGEGSPGRIRLESFIYNFTGTFGSNGVTRSLPGVLFLPADTTPIRILSVGGVAMPANASGSFDPADIVINAAGMVEVEIEAHGIPVGTVVKLSLFPDGAETVTADSSPLAGTEAVSTATANVLVPHGFSRFYITANWTP